MYDMCNFIITLHNYIITFLGYSQDFQPLRVSYQQIIARYSSDDLIVFQQNILLSDFMRKYLTWDEHLFL